MKLTQHQLIIEYVKQRGSITPARLSDTQRAFMGGFIGSEAIRRCQELVEHKKESLLKYPRLYVHKEGKFAVFTLTPYEEIQESQIVKEFREELETRSKQAFQGVLI